VQRVLVTDLIDPSGIALLQKSAEVLRPPDTSLETLRALSREADAVITRSRLPDDLFDAAPRIRAVTIHGTGTDLVNLTAATARGIMVANIPGGNAQSVAEYCLMAILLLGRNFRGIDASLRTEAWDTARSRAEKAVEVEKKTLGIVGVGHIGKRLAKMCSGGLSMRILGNQRRLDALPQGVEPAAIEKLLAESDFVVLTCPLTAETRHLMNAERLRMMKETAFLINVGRGPVIDEAALVEALRNETIAGAMLDVYEHYRLEPGHPLLSLPNAVLTPHLAGSTRESRKRAGIIAAEETLRMLEGQRPLNLVNPDSIKHPR
jgi:D-3-phosphoglycerate dehydrogenase / 2-oxoglutarate reductase